MSASGKLRALGADIETRERRITFCAANPRERDAGVVLQALTLHSVCFITRSHKPRSVR